MEKITPEPLKLEKDNRDTLYNLIELIARRVCKEVEEKTGGRCEPNIKGMKLLKQAIKDEFEDDTIYLGKDICATVEWLKDNLVYTEGMSMFDLCQRHTKIIDQVFPSLFKDDKKEKDREVDMHEN